MRYILILKNREPLSYGEESVGIKTLIKRVNILLPTRGEVVQVPAILGNGIRGILRDTMTNVFLEKVAEKAGKNLEIDARVFLLMLSGGILARKTTETEEVTAKRIDELRKKASVLLPLNIMGFALSNVMVPSKMKVSVFYPICEETYDLVKDLVDNVKQKSKENYLDALKEVKVRDLIKEVQMMRKDDKGMLVNAPYEVKYEVKEEEESLQAIFQREYIVPGTVFIGYISEIVPFTDAERELLALSIKELERRGGIGGAVARGFGSFTIEFSELQEKNTGSLEEFIKNNQEKILEALKSNPETWLSGSAQQSSRG